MLRFSMGSPYQLALLQFVCTGASCQNGHAEIPAHQILDGSYIIYFQYDIKFIQRYIIAFQMRNKRFLVPESGRRRIRFSFLSSFNVTILFRDRDFIGYGKDQGICIQHYGIEIESEIRPSTMARSIS